MTADTDAGAAADLEVDFGADGLVPAVAQDAADGEVLMLAYVSPEALRRTVETGRAHYYSRSRDELWEKGATSGNTQKIQDVRVDCDADTLLYVVEQDGGACHTGYRSCFHRSVQQTADGQSVAVETTGEQVFNPAEAYDETGE
ncbi:phosphoribosyl-AMP cyclohydrolase [Halolamina sp.]|jgi:phosphoribosyl-AMP cyclohydrolase|uniref:phosphoribosyl-AMP cyclohydrolase n=1 Tax=Halolamina sp. TaxID=1940283 RepID=UPI000223C077|nr:Phosphoribosyl-AMP cyclohydrolase [halophilic archaeon DL31]